MIVTTVKTRRHWLIWELRLLIWELLSLSSVLLTASRTVIELKSCTPRCWKLSFFCFVRCSGKHWWSE